MHKLQFDAVIFDLDGVITQTASVHCKAWKLMFDEYLKNHYKKKDNPYIPFNKVDDYLKYIDGKPRYDGVRSFLYSRNIKLPTGYTTDNSNKETICGLGNKKNKIFNNLINKDPVKVFHSTVKLIKKLKQIGIKVGVCTSSKNCEHILKSVDLYHFFNTFVDAIVAEQLKLNGKPEPDIFEHACKNLEVSINRSVIIEDAVSGVQAGKSGNFGLVIGIARENNKLALLKNGADIVVKDLCEININTIENWFSEGLKKQNWSLSYYGLLENNESTIESHLAVGNGYFCSRGSLEELSAGNINYPGTYISRVYNKLESKINGKKVVNEDLVNCPNWLPIIFKLGKDNWLDYSNVKIIFSKRTLFFNNGVLYKKIIIRDKKGRETLIESKRIASMENPHLAALRYNITALNYSDTITVKTGLDGNIINNGVKRYSSYNSKHLEIIDTFCENNISQIKMRTNNSNIRIEENCKLIVYSNYNKIFPEMISCKSNNSIFTVFNKKITEGSTITIDKIVSVFTSNHKDYSDTKDKSKIFPEKIKSFEDVMAKSEKKWDDIWKKVDIQIQGDRLTQKLLRFNLYHLLISVSPHNVNIDSGYPGRGLHGEAYRGHIFWDEIFILPIYFLHYPEVAKSILLYRYKRLDMARKNAADNGFKGAMFPWQSGSTGAEESQEVHLNPLTDKWGPDYSRLQRHVSLSIAYNIWYYYWFTWDKSFLIENGAEMFFEICRFWADISEYNSKTNRYEIRNLMGPDEFHEKNTDNKEGGLKDNSYTNIMVVWLFNKAFKIIDLLGQKEVKDVFNKIKIKKEELSRWDDIRKKINLILSDKGILSQFDGYFTLKELDWDEYKRKYKNIYRMDRILRSEGKSADDYKVSKQADALMILYNLTNKEINNIFNQINYKMRKDFVQSNFNYYFNRTSHGSTLSRVVHSYIANLIEEKETGWKLFIEVLKSDYMDIQGGTTGEGIHPGVMAGSVLLILCSYIGLELRNDVIQINPSLPGNWEKIKFNFLFRGDKYSFVITCKYIKIAISSKTQKIFSIIVNKVKYFINAGEHKNISYEKKREKK